MAEADLVHVLITAADRLQEILTRTSPGPWFYNSYSAIFSQPKLNPYERWCDDNDEHTLERHGECAGCGSQQPDPGRGADLRSGCKLYGETYRREPLAARVLPSAGDSAHGEHAANAQYIEALNPLAGAALVTILRAAADEYRDVALNFPDDVERDPVVVLARTILAAAR